MINSTHDMKVATAPSCSRVERGQDLAYAVRANGIFGAVTGGVWTLDPHTTKLHHSLRERRT